MPQTEMTLKEITNRGWEIYIKEIRPRVIDQHHGKFLVINVESGDYEVDENETQAGERLKARHPEGHLYLVRIGYRTAYSIGAQSEPDIP
jgi:hypothetical protein